jgi:bifunctional DNA-binding transcriptional regulator/antitoxin component of YhaV-PrlF toxin-antitoxin module
MTLTMAKDGSIVIPLEARKKLGLENGGELELYVTANGFLAINDDASFEGEIYTPKRKAELLLNNAFTKEEWDEIVASLLAEGIDPKAFPSIDMSARESLQTDAEWEAKVNRAHQRTAQQVA